MTESGDGPDVIRSVNGWVLDTESEWDATDDGGANLVAIRMPRPETLELEFYLLSGTNQTISFDTTSDLKVQGNLQWQGEADNGWEVLETSMFYPDPPLEDGRHMYVLDLPTAVLQFKSHRGKVS